MILFILGLLVGYGVFLGLIGKLLGFDAMEFGAKGVGYTILGGCLLLFVCLVFSLL